MTKSINCILEEVRIFSALSKETRTRLIADSTQLKLPCDKTLFHRGDQADAIYVVLSGEVAIEIMSPQGQTVRVATLKVGSVFGEIAVLDFGPRTADARVTQTAQVLRIEAATFHRLITESPAFALLIIQDLAGKLRLTDSQIEDISFKSLRSRLAALLTRMACDADGTKPTLQITQASLAEQLSATREKVNVHLQTMQRANALLLKRGKIDIVDVERLTKFIDE